MTFWLHASLTWDEVVISTNVQERRLHEFFEYTSFLESFVFMLSSVYFAGPRIYRLLREHVAAFRFEGEKRNTAKEVHFYAAAIVMIKRLLLDNKLAVPPVETVAAILIILTPVLVALVQNGALQKPKGGGP